jgi:hypothetical protein
MNVNHHTPGSTSLGHEACPLITLESFGSAASCSCVLLMLTSAHFMMLTYVCLLGQPSLGHDFLALPCFHVLAFMLFLSIGAMCFIFTRALASSDTNVDV